MIVFPNAKINLGLNITEKRPDGFHNLETVFYPIPWEDVLEIIPSTQFEFSSSGISIDGAIENNLCVKVYNSLKERFHLPSIKIHLHKNIPIGAGLGGGSADAAFTARLLNTYFKLSLTDAELEDIVRPLGSDCAFFIKNQPIYAYGKGDQFESIDLSLKGKWILLINPTIHISTKEAYAGIKPAMPEVSIKTALQLKITEWKNVLVNDFEKSIFPNYPILKDIKEDLYSIGAIYASMSGSGSTMFGIFEAPIEYQDYLQKGYLIQTGYLS